MRYKLQEKKWSAYLVGIGIGFLVYITVLFTNKIIGMSSAFAFLASKCLCCTTCYSCWSTLLLIGTFLGAFVAARLSKTKHSVVPHVWQKSFGPSKIKRAIFAIIGGIILILGARIAGGCSSGHVISGASQLATSGWIFAIGLFASGIITSHLVYKGESN